MPRFASRAFPRLERMMAAELKSQDDVFKLPLPTKDEAVYFDRGPATKRAKGLGLRVRSNGSRTWAYFYRQKGRSRKFVIGTATEDRSGWTLDKARAEAHALRVLVDKGQDPGEVRRAARAAIVDAKTFAQTVKAYLDARRETMKPRSHDATARHLNKHWKPLHRRLVHEIDGDMIADRLKAIEAESGAATRNRARSSLSKMFSWAIGERFSKHLRANPVVGTIKAEENKARDRTLSDAELVAIWNAAPESGYGRIVQLLMLTGQRREEIGSLRWSEVEHLDEPEMAQIVLPAERTKNSRAHEVPLSAPAIDVLKAHHRDANRDLIFGEGEGGYSGWSRSRARLHKLSGVRDWTLHDLRRTAATGMADLGVQPHIVEAILNHVSGHKAGVAGIYNRSTYSAEKRAALDLWARHLISAVAKREAAKMAAA